MKLQKFVSSLMISLLLFYNVAFPISFPDDKIIIAVVDFINTSQDDQYDFLEKTIPEAIITNLAKRGNIEIVERSRLTEALKEMELGMTGILDEHTAVEVGRAVGANAILLGSFVSIGDIIRINARLIDVETSKIIKAEIVQGGVGKEIFKLMDELAESMEAQLIGEIEQIVQDQPIPIEDKKETERKPSLKKPFYKSGWFFAVIGVAAAAGIAIAISSSGGDNNNSSVNITVNIP